MKLKTAVCTFAALFTFLTARPLFAGGGWFEITNNLQNTHEPIECYNLQMACSRFDFVLEKKYIITKKSFGFVGRYKQTEVINFGETKIFNFSTNSANYDNCFIKEPYLKMQCAPINNGKSLILPQSVDFNVEFGETEDKRGGAVIEDKLENRQIRLIARNYNPYINPPSNIRTQKINFKVLNNTDQDLECILKEEEQEFSNPDINLSLLPLQTKEKMIPPIKYKLSCNALGQKKKIYSCSDIDKGPSFSTVCKIDLRQKQGNVLLELKKGEQKTILGTGITLLTTFYGENGFKKQMLSDRVPFIIINPSDMEIDCSIEGEAMLINPSSRKSIFFLREKENYSLHCFAPIRNPQFNQLRNKQYKKYINLAHSLDEKIQLHKEAEQVICYLRFITPDPPGIDNFILKGELLQIISPPQKPPEKDRSDWGQFK